MQIRNLKLLNFRNYHSLELSFDEGLNIFYGQNGAGKTNIIEAIYFLALSRSFINIEDKNVISFDKEICKVEGTIFDKSENNFKIIIKSSGKNAKINNNSIIKLSDYISKIKIVLFHSDDLKIIKDSPGIRRKILNIEISQININYLKNLSIYNKLVKQRNAYLKMLYVNSNESIDYLKILNEKMVNYGYKVYLERKKQLEIINKNIDKYFKKFNNNPDSLVVEYISDYDNLSIKEILKKMEHLLSKDLFLKKTSFGVHHDDIVFKLNDHNLRLFGSEGQQKNAVIAYKFAEIESIKEQSKIQPIFILDDLFGELDKEKINNILDTLESKSQTFITTTDIDYLSDKIINNSKKIFIENGKIEER